jgi:hemolysin activation/secretion protein
MAASRNSAARYLLCGAMRSPLAHGAARVAAIATLLVWLPAPVRADGAWSFEAARKLYPSDEIGLDDVVVPHVEVDPHAVLPKGVGDGPELEIKSYEVVGATLITPSEVRALVAPHLGPGRYMSDVQAARNALQNAYEERGYPTVSVTLPQQTLLDGRVRIEVVETRLGRVGVDNPGIDWYSEEALRRATPHLQTGALVRTEDLQEDLARANSSRDRRVTPVLKAGEPGTADVELKVDDRIPVHGSVEWNNYRTPGTPRQRMSARLAYDDLWQRDHKLALQYTFVPSRENFDDVQVWVLSYGAPNPWREGDGLFAYAAWSDTASILPTNSAINSLGQGFTTGARYNLSMPLPWVDWEWYSHGLTLGVDYKSIDNALVEGVNTIRTPIRYLPWSVAYQGTVIRPHGFATVSLATDFHFAGTIDSGGAKEDFQTNRGGIDSNNPVDGTYAAYRVDVDTTLRLPALLQTLGQGRFLDLRAPTVSFDDDASLVVGLSGQYANEPLISVEQFPLGGRYSVRGYMEGEWFGDHGWDLQAEIRTPALHGFLGGLLGEKIQGLLFYDVGAFYLLETLEHPVDNPGGNPRELGDEFVDIDENRLQAVGLGLRSSFLENRYGSVRGEAFLAMPTIETTNTKRTPHLFFQVRAEF